MNEGMEVIDLELPEAPVRVGIVASRFNRFITDQLLEGALEALQRNGVHERDVVVVWVPGAFELPLAADRLLAARDLDGVIALGAVIRGGTPHFDYVAGECSRGLAAVGLERGKPLMFGVLTTDTLAQAVERASVEQGRKGFDVAMGLLHMVQLQRRLANEPPADGR